VLRARSTAGKEEKTTGRNIFISVKGKKRKKRKGIFAEKKKYHLLFSEKRGLFGTGSINNFCQNKRERLLPSPIYIPAWPELWATREKGGKRPKTKRPSPRGGGENKRSCRKERPSSPTNRESCSQGRKGSTPSIFAEEGSQYLPVARKRPFAVGGGEIG